MNACFGNDFMTTISVEVKKGIRWINLFYMWNEILHVLQ
ncbi:hypothetical protein F383_17137 [Gossypium arboreum]|uniref:Uncharacterized protein n=1 Tax=Gossypium arboreum TaxID=29729 RepID=A0A0B0NUU9_GOSAR|nr:hypothetical protein F383_17137 [Gossypium arboreum]